MPPDWLAENSLTEDEIQRWVAEFERAQRAGHVKLLTPLPRKVRLRLWFARQVDRAGGWLVEHGRFGLAKALWLACGGWQ